MRERNKRRHGNQPLPMLVLSKLIDKVIRNKFNLVQSKGVRDLKEFCNTGLTQDCKYGFDSFARR